MTSIIRRMALAFLCMLIAAGWCEAQMSRGQIGDSNLDRIHSEATRFYYHMTDTTVSYLENVRDETGSFYDATVYGLRTESIAENALEDFQVLYYDYYPPLITSNKANKVCAIYFHGGGYTVGYANQGYDTEIRPLRERGFHVISVEYRRGWFGDGSMGPGTGEPDISDEEGDQAEFAFAYALDDCKEAWTHMNRNQPGHARHFSATTGFAGFSQKYVMYGYSAGGSLASRLSLVEPIPGGRQVVGAICGYGTHAVTDTVSNFNTPVLLQVNLLDTISPAYDNFVYFDDDMPTAKGVFNLYDELVAGGASVRLVAGATADHGRGFFNLSDGSPEYLHPAITLFKKAYQGSPLPNYQEFKFRFPAKYTLADGALIEVDDTGGLYEQIGPSPLTQYVADIDLMDPTRLFVDGFTYDGTIVVPSGFRYEPIQSELEAGVSPETIRATYGTFIP